MKTIIASAIASLALVAFAHAGEVEGKVASVEGSAITLEDGQTFTAAEGVDVSAVEAGSMVMITFDDGTTNATAVEVGE